MPSLASRIGFVILVSCVPVDAAEDAASTPRDPRNTPQSAGPAHGPSGTAGPAVQIGRPCRYFDCAAELPEPPEETGDPGPGLCGGRPRDCAAVFAQNPAGATSGDYEICPVGGGAITSYCVMDGIRGWTIVDPGRAPAWSSRFTDWGSFAAGLVRGVGVSARSWRAWFLADDAATLFALSPDCHTVGDLNQVYRMSGNYYGCRWFNDNCNYDGSCRLCTDDIGQWTAGTCPWIDDGVGGFQGQYSPDFTYPHSCSVDWWNSAPSIGVNGTHCVAYTRPEHGACCQPGGTCSFSTESACIAAGGTFSGIGTDCSPNECPQPQLGACCHQYGCFVGTFAECQTPPNVGSWNLGATCGSVSCCITNASCNDGDPCDGSETCVSWMCQPGTPPNCDDANACTTDACGPGGCTNSPIPNCCTADSECADASACTLDSCVDNICRNEGVGPIGACCLSYQGSGCQIMTQCQCDETVGGEWAGAATTCDPCTCPIGVKCTFTTTDDEFCPTEWRSLDVSITNHTVWPIEGTWSTAGGKWLYVLPDDEEYEIAPCVTQTVSLPVRNTDAHEYPVTLEFFSKDFYCQKSFRAPAPTVEDYQPRAKGTFLDETFSYDNAMTIQLDWEACTPDKVKLVWEPRNVELLVPATGSTVDTSVDMSAVLAHARQTVPNVLKLYPIAEGGVQGTEYRYTKFGGQTAHPWMKGRAWQNLFSYQFGHDPVRIKLEFEFRNWAEVTPSYAWSKYFGPEDTQLPVAGHWGFEAEPLKFTGEYWVKPANTTQGAFKFALTKSAQRDRPFKMRAGKGKWSIGGEVSFSGEARIYPEIFLKSLGFTGSGSVSVSAGFPQVYFPIGPIPPVFYVQGKVEAGIQETLNLVIQQTDGPGILNSHLKFADSPPPKFKAAASLRFGVGTPEWNGYTLVDFSGAATLALEVEPKAWWPLTETNGKLELTASLRSTVLIWSRTLVEGKLGSGSWSPWSWEWTVQFDKDRAAGTGEPWKPAERVASDVTRQRPPGGELASLGAPGAEPLLSDVWPQTRPAIVAEGEELWVAIDFDDVSLPQDQALEIGVLHFDGQAWSAVQPITDDMILDTQPALGRDSTGRLVAVWMRLPGVPPGADPESATPHAEVAFSVRDSGTAGWSVPVLMTSNAHQDWPARLVTGEDGSLTAFWLGSPDNSLTISPLAGGTIQANLYSALWTGSSFGAPHLELNGLATDRAPSILVDANGDVHAVWASHTDGDALTLDDIELYYARKASGAWSAPERLTTNVRLDAVPELTRLPSGDLLVVWTRTGVPVQIAQSYGPPIDTFEAQILWSPRTAGIWSAEQVVVRSPGIAHVDSVRDPSGEVWILWAAGSDNHASDLWAARFDVVSGTWSAPVQVTTDPSIETSPRAARDDDGNLQLVYLRREFHAPSDLFDGAAPSLGQTDLMHLEVRAEVDLAISSDEVRIEPPDAVPGDPVEIVVPLYNNGLRPAHGASVRIYLGDPLLGGQPLQTIAVTPSPLAGGTAKELTAQWVLPSAGPAIELFMVADPDDALSEADETNNVATLPLYSPKLVGSIDAATSCDSNGTTMTVFAQIFNDGPAHASGPVSWLLRRVNDGSVLASGMVPPIAAGQSASLQMSTGVSSNLQVELVVDPSGTIPQIERPANDIVSLVGCPGCANACDYHCGGDPVCDPSCGGNACQAGCDPCNAACPGTTGACCAEESCHDAVTATCCAQLGGAWSGAGSSCPSVPFGSAATSEPVLNSTALVDGASADVHPSIATDGRGNWVAAWGSAFAGVGGGIGTDFDVLFARSDDGGASWSAAAPLNSNAAGDAPAATDSDVSIATDGGGIWLAAWSSSDATGGLGPDFDVLVSRSLNSGASWSAQQPLNGNAASDAPTAHDERPTLANDRQGTWIAAWQSSSDLNGTLGPDLDILTATSHNDGATWSAPHALNGNAAIDGGDDRDVQVETSWQGIWVAVWSSADSLGGTIGSDLDILFARSTDDGATWSPPASLNSNAGLDSAGDDQPRIATDGLSHWLVVWRSQDPLGGDDDLLLATSMDDGMTWSAPSTLHPWAAADSADDSDPSLTTDRLGTWVVIWQSAHDPNLNLGSDHDLWVMRSSDLGASWTDPQPLNPSATTDATDDAFPVSATDQRGLWITVWQKSAASPGTGADVDLLRATVVLESETSSAACELPDDCPSDPNKTDPGTCGCGVPDTDGDDDGIADCVDNCPAAPNSSQVDRDTDDAGDACDICPTVPGACEIGSLLVYYGFPSAINGSTSVSEAAAHFAAYTHVIVGDGLQDPGHPDHQNLADILADAAMAETTVHGYIDVGVETLNLSLAEIQARVEAWHATGVDGVLLDSFGYDAGTSRLRQNAVVELLHARGMAAVVDAFEPSDALGRAVEPTFNPNGLPPSLGPGDFYLFSNHQISQGEFVDEPTWLYRALPLEQLRKSLGVEVLSVTTADVDGPSGYDVAKFFYAWHSALLYGHAATGWGEFEFSSEGVSSDSAPFRARPDAIVGTSFAGPVVAASPLFSRATDNGTAFVRTDTHQYGFTPNAAASPAALIEPKRSSRAP